MGVLLLASGLEAQNYGILKKIFDPDGAEGDKYGFSVGVSDSVAVVGAPLDDIGTAHVYFRNEGGEDNWGFVQRLEITDGATGDQFGFSVAVSDTIVVVGAPFQDGGGSNLGAAYVFSQNTGGPNNWGQVTKLVPSGIGSQDEFGAAVTISGGVIAVGARENTNGTVHLFYKDQGGTNNWGEVTVIMASDAASGDLFGYSLDMRDSVLVVGAPDNDVIGSDDGSAYVFSQNLGGADNWGEVTQILASDAAGGDKFGTSVALDSVTIVIGSPFDDDEGLNSGSAYIYIRDLGGANNWGELKKIVGSSTAAEDEFGHSVSVSRDVILVGVPEDDDSGASSGTTFIFRKDQGGVDNWGETQRLQAFDAVSGDQFGFAVDIEGPFLYVGAPMDDDSGINSGSVYIYRESEIICPDVPTVDCQDITVNLDASGIAEINAGEINAGASGSCEFNVTLSQSVFSCDDIGGTLVTLTLVDLVGNQVECNATVTVIDALPPSFLTCPEDTLVVSNNADACEGNIIWSIPAAEDNCSIDSIVQTAGPTPGTSIPLGTYDIQYVAYDAQGMTDTCDFVLQIVDTQAPFLACPPSIVVDNDVDECDWTSAPGQLDPLIAIDNCEPVLTYMITTSTGVVSSDSGRVMTFDFPVGVNTICYMITDSSATQADTCCFTVTVEDVQIPDITCSPDDSIGTDDELCSANYSWTHPNPTDNCAVDSMTMTIMLADGSASIVTVPPGSYGGPMQSILPVGSNVILYVVVDTSGNMNSCFFEVIVFDDENPTVTCPTDITVNTSDGGMGDCAATVTFTHPTPSDNCEITSFTSQILNPDGSVEGPLEVTGGDMRTRDFDLGVSTLSYIAVDGNMNSAVCTYNITVVDDENPSFVSCPTDTITVGTNVDVCEASVSWATPIAFDNCGVDSVVQISGPLPGESLAPGFYTVVYVAYDGATPPNTDTCTFVIRVIDTQDPMIACPSNDVVVGTDPGVCTWTAPAGSLSPTVATGNCPYAVTWDVFKDGTLQASGSDDVSGNHTFELGESIVCYYIIETEDPDGNGFNTDTCCFSVIVEDREVPVITCPADVTFLDSQDEAMDCQHTMGSPALDATATDNCSVVSITHDYDSPDNTTLVGAVFPVGETVITWTAVDTAGNIATCSFTVTVEDDIDPVIVCPPDVTITTSDGGAGDCLGELEWTHPTPTDNCEVTQYNYTVTNADGTQSGPFDLVPLLNPNAPAALFSAAFDFQLGTSTVAYHAEDAAGNTFDCSFAVGVTDDEAPSFVNCPEADTLTLGTDVDNCSANVNWAIPIAEDNCDVTVSQIEGPMPGDELAPGFYTITYLAEDGATPANTDTCSFVLNIVDTQEPLIACPSNDVVASTDEGQCSWTSPAQSLSPIVAIANCPYNITWAVFKDDTLQGSGVDDVSGYVFDLDTSLVCYYIEEAEDPDSNGILTDTCCFLVIVQDNERPMITCPADVTFLDSQDDVEDCQHTMGSTALDATATDNCSVVSITHDYDSPDNTTLVGAVFPVGITVITWTAVDTAGNISTCSFFVTVEDDINPLVICPTSAEITTSNNGSLGDCLGEYNWTHPGPTDNCAVTQYNYRIINSDGTISGPFDLVPLLNDSVPAELFDASYNFQLDTSTVEYYVEDAAGNLDTCTFTIIVTDDEAPEFLNCPTDTLNFANEVDECGAYANYTPPIAEDNCDVTVELDSGPAPSEFVAPGFYTVVYIAVDGSGNADTCEFVIRILDTQIPDIECPSNEVVVSADAATCEWISPAGSLSPISAFDNCAYAVTWEKTNPDGTIETGMDDVSGETFALDTTMICYIITEVDDPDSNGILADTCCFIVIVEDNELPVITCPADVTFQDTDDMAEDCQHTMGGAALDATATDNCAIVSITHDYDSPDSTTLLGAVWPVGTTTITWTAIDTAGNEISCSFNVTVQDMVVPTITCPTDVTISTSVGGADECLGELEWTHATASDNCDISIFNVNYTNPDGTTEGPFDLLNPVTTTGDRQFAIGTSTVTYYVEDPSGNSNTCSFTVFVQDDEMPIFVNCPDTITVGNDPSLCGALVNWPDPIAVDNCNDTLTVIQIGGPPSGSFIDVGADVTITYEATDDENNTVQCSFIVTVEDTEMPTAVCMDTVIYVDAAGMASITADDINGASTDNCAIDSLAASFTAFTCDHVGENNVLLTVYDASGNIAACVSEVTVLDTLAPIFTCPPDTLISICDQIVPDVISGLVGTDNCGGVTFSQSPVAGVLFILPAGDTLVIVVEATDVNGNTSTCEVNAIISDEDCTQNCAGDVLPPEWINCPRPPINVSAEPDMCEAFVNFSLPVALDNCELDTIIQIDTTGLTTGDMFPVGLTILSWLAVDTEGNISDTCTIKIFVNDQQPPQILCPSDTTAINELGGCGAQIDGLDVVALDNCLAAVTFKVTDTDKFTITNGGGGDVSGIEFGCGVFEVTYMVQDQPIILFSEVTHELEAFNGGTNPVPPFIQTTDGDDFVEITNYGPTTMDLSCLTVERIGGNNEIFVVPQGVILAVGDVLTIHYGGGTDSPADHFFNVPGAADLDQSTPAGYVMSIDTVALDVVAVNGFNPVGQATMSSISMMDWEGGDIMMSEGGSAFRQWPWDSNNSEDYAVSDLCDVATIGTLNPNSNLLDDIGITYSLQSLPPNKATCSFLVSVQDTELPRCGELIPMAFAGPGAVIGPGEVVTAVIDVPNDFVVGDVNVLSLAGTHPDMSDLVFKLRSPQSSTLLLEGLCPGAADFNINLDQEAAESIETAPCGPLGAGGTYSPLGDLTEFNGDQSLGQWVLTIANANPNASAVLNSWILEISEAVDYSQTDVTLENDPGECGAVFMWTHPVVLDNCSVGQVFVEYTSEDGIVVPEGGEVVGGSDATEFFEVGTTTVTYTVVDKSGNEGTCSFDVTVEDTEVAVLICPADIIIDLGPGECAQVENIIPDIVGDNCAIDSVWSNPPTGTAFPIGTTEVTIYALDASGNIDSCTFNVTVNEFVPEDTGLTCNNLVNLSLDQTCMYVINADVILEGDDYGCYDDYCIIAIDANGDTIPDNTITIEHVGQTISVTVIDCEGEGNSCWGEIFVEDKLGPAIVCPDDISVACNESTDILVTGTPEVQSCELETFMDFDDEVIDGDACSDPRIEILRTWYVTDDSDNTSSCVQRVTVQPFQADLIEFPPHFIHDTEFSCEDVAADPSLTEPDNTGYPTINGQPIFGDHYCEINVGYWDEFLQDANCAGGYEILRNWVIRDECQPLEPGVNPIRYIQSINVKDDNAPEINAWVDMNVDNTTAECSGTIHLGATPFDLCTEVFDVVWFVLYSEGGLTQIVANGELPYTNSVQLELGRSYDIVFVAEDACHNIARDTISIELIDDIPPVPNCDEHTIVSLSTDGNYGLTLVDASVFDDGSYDNCGDVTLRVRRMDSCIDFDWTTQGAGIDDVPNGSINSRDRGTVHRPMVPFACCDVGAGPVMVELEVTDAAGNINFCMVEVEVQDKLAPYIECPEDIVVSCDFWFDSEVATNQFIPLSEDPMNSVFGTVLDAFEYNDDESARQLIIINDPGRPSSPSDPDYLPQPYVWGIDGWADDNCDLDLDVFIKILDDCSGEDPQIPAIPSDLISDERANNEVRFIERRFRATDNQDNASTCRQRIWVVDFDPFFITDETCNNPNPNDGVIWPCDKLYESCPDSIAVDEPTIFDDNCSLIGVTYEDTRFDFVDDACYKILREWKVIDWCHFNVNTGAGLWTYTQVIKVIDNDGPEFTDCPEGPVTLCAADDGVSLPDNNQVFLGEEDPDHTYCSVHVQGSLTVEEFCSEYVIYDVKVYPFNGPNYYQIVDKTQIATDENGQAVLPYDTKSSPVPAIRTNGLPYNSPYCGDYHRVLWSVEDGCGNSTTCEYLLRLEDCKQPSPVCINGLSTVVMPIGGTVTIWAKEYDASSIDDCTPSENLLFSFSGDTYQPSMQYNCDNVPAFGAELSVEVWVADEGVDHDCNGQITWAERNKDFCTTTIVVTDNDGVCGTGNVIAGEVMTHADLEPVEMTTITLTHPTNVFPSVQTIEDGKYTFTNVPVEGPYTITANRNDDHKNGVSTLDLVRIQKHLLGIEPFTSTYQYIAADANNTESISALDLVEIRKLILGIYAEFPNNSSWRFVDSKYEFSDVTNPWPFNESITIDNLESLNIDEDFMAVKVGDLNNTAVANADQVVIRNGREVVFAKAISNKEVVKSGESVEIEVSIPSDMLGFQWTLDLDGLDYIRIESDQLSDENVGVHNDQITMSFARTTIGEEATFKLIFEAAKPGNPQDMVSVSDDITESEGYIGLETSAASDPGIEIVNISLDFGLQNVGLEFALYQNEPNPFSQTTTISFTLPEAMSATFTIVDATGKVVKEVKGDYAAGMNSIEMLRNDIGTAGIYYYRIDADGFTASKKMIVIE